MDPLGISLPAPAVRMPRALRGRTGKVSLVLGCSIHQGAVEWQKPPATRPEKENNLIERQRFVMCEKHGSSLFFTNPNS